MANQFSGSFEHKVQQRFNSTAELMLNEWADQGMSYHDVEKLTGFSHGTIRKWAKRFNIELTPMELDDSIDQVAEEFYSDCLNQINFLSRGWNRAS